MTSPSRPENVDVDAEYADAASATGASRSIPPIDRDGRLVTLLAVFALSAATFVIALIMISASNA